MSEKQSAPKATPRTDPEEPAASEETYTLREHALAAIDGSYGPGVRSEHVAGAAIGSFPGQMRLTRAQMQQALDEFNRRPLGPPEPYVDPRGERAAARAATEPRSQRRP